MYKQNNKAQMLRAILIGTPQPKQKVNIFNKIVATFKRWLGKQIYFLYHQHEILGKEQLQDYSNSYGGGVTRLNGTVYAPSIEYREYLLTKEAVIQLLKENKREHEIDLLKDYDSYKGSTKKYEDGSHDNEQFLEQLLKGKRSDRLGRIKDCIKSSKEDETSET